MINLALKSEMSFQQCFGKVKDIVEHEHKKGAKAVGIADLNNTYAHYKLWKECKRLDMLPVFGVRLMVVPKKLIKEKQFGPVVVILAKNAKGLKLINRLVTIAHDNFYYHPFIEDNDINKSLDRNHIIVIGDDYSTDVDVDATYVAPYEYKNRTDLDNWFPVFIQENHYLTASDKQAYEMLSDSLHIKYRDAKPRHILTEKECLRNPTKAIDNSFGLLSSIASFDLPKADMVRWQGKRNPMNEIQDRCIDRYNKVITVWSDEYKERYMNEMALISKKGYADYFLIVADMIDEAKKTMLVGPGRGSSGGSLVCYLLGITNVDPIKYNLLFERFIDINREDLPDIDIDFPDTHRSKVIKRLIKKYGTDKVSHLATISTLKPSSAINECAKAIHVPKYVTEQIKDSVIPRPEGHPRASKCLEDTFATTELGTNFIAEYPDMINAAKLEGHARHSGIHAAAIIVANEPLTNYGGINTRKTGDDGSKNIAGTLMLDKKSAEGLNLLKIDCLGLKTLSVLMEVADLVGFEYSRYSNLNLLDREPLRIFNEGRLSGIFQFQGEATKKITKDMGVSCFNDLVDINALCRPGPLHSGGATHFVKRRTGKEKVEHLSSNQIIKDITDETYGIILYQEQLMHIARQYGGMTWERVSELRKAVSKSLGREAMQDFKDEFIAGALKNDLTSKEEAGNIFEHMVTFGAYAFNKSHSVAYAMISYWCAWAKHNYPLEFAAANLNHSGSDDESVRLLRDMVRNDNVEYVAIDPDTSLLNWSIDNGILLGGLTSVKGVGKKKAQDIITARTKGGFTKGLIKLMLNPVTPFDILFPVEHYFGVFFDNPEENGLNAAPTLIKDIDKPDTYIFIGQLKDIELQDLNEYSRAKKRGSILHEDSYMSALEFEDDTGKIRCQIGRFNFQNVWPSIKDGIPDESWYMIKGTLRDGWHKVEIEAVQNLKEFM